MNNITILNRNNCTGCRMCEQICPTKAIKMIENSWGFIEYSIEVEKCIGCGKCAKRCPQLISVVKNKIDEKNVFAAKSNNKKIQESSSSGGIAHEIAKNFLIQRGIVYGCELDKTMNARHVRITKLNELNKIQGSKYVQSDTNNSFECVKNDLNDGRNVLYIGTPCQIAGLKSYLGQKYEKLCTIDLLCHGVPSNKLFKEYINWLEKKYNSKILKYEFRNKEKAYWGFGYKSKVVFEEKVRFFDKNEDSFLKLFVEGKSLRNACYECQYAQKERIGDLTLGDFWGIELEYRKLYDKKGVSLVTVNNEKGKEILFKYAKDYRLDKVDIEKAEKYADTLKKPCRKVDSSIYEELNNQNIDKIFKIERNVKNVLKKYIPYWLKLKLRR